MNWQDEPKLLPEASLGRRVIALVIDWTMSRLIASLIGPYLSMVKVVSYPEQFRVPATKIALRTLLICMVVPAVFTKDGRSLHDFLTNTQTVRELY